jgi:hypothetical protein
VSISEEAAAISLVDPVRRPLTDCVKGRPGGPEKKEVQMKRNEVTA